jgi:hypothetical protein
MPRSIVQVSLTQAHDRCIAWLFVDQANVSKEFARRQNRQRFVFELLRVFIILSLQDLDFAVDNEIESHGWVSFLDYNFALLKELKLDNTDEFFSKNLEGKVVENVEKFPVLTSESFEKHASSLKSSFKCAFSLAVNSFPCFFISFLSWIVSTPRFCCFRFMTIVMFF